MDSQVQKLFVYGTPLKSEARSINLKECELLKTSSIPGNLYTTKYEYPAAIFDINSKNKIFGELYKIPNNIKRFLNNPDKINPIFHGFLKVVFDNIHSPPFKNP